MGFLKTLSYKKMTMFVPFTSAPLSRPDRLQTELLASSSPFILFVSCVTSDKFLHLSEPFSVSVKTEDWI